MMLQSQMQLQSSIFSTTCFRTVYHEHGRYKTINGNSFVHDGHEYRINTRIGSGVRHDILMSTINELIAIQKRYSRVYLTRFDLHLPALTSVEAGNEYIRKLFKRLRSRLASRNNGLSEPIIDFAYGWVCEQENASQPHYHCWIAFPHRQVRWFGTPDRGIAGVITEIWMKLTGGEATLVHLTKATKTYPNHYVIYRDDPESLDGPIFWLSYLAKERGKSQTGKGTRLYTTSKLSRKTLDS
ncbi:inovirus-type Gp2 protein [Enterobacter asburiae]|uniref:YagK/YfjJ domain-containing protein n=1 Tax=Enterobacteriaceae TaxID=543 RepID=UPI0003313844|nr:MULTISPECIES: inovirus-type Gp2 protein [Enterobacteriaceae]POV63192.1 inovirus Gp2 family protein [Citrobacter freundii complex sp. CFNIH11]QPB93773.1 Inovirus-type protein [uncultured bacterium]ELK6673629.1 inovirus-type Gp2 protein [Citrobacter freundii]ELK7631721.1 inovirus-type Gp2 protein [Citrobacter freundii]ELP5718548.1 inovirus-type Gp2 protein [Enterobacter asburiae]